MNPATKIGVSVRTKTRTQSASAHAKPATSHRSSHSTFDRAERTPPSRHPTATAAERSPPRMPRKHSISRVPVEYRPHDRNAAPSPIRKRAQSESVTDEYMLLNAPTTPSSSSNASCEHEITALEDQVLALEGDLVSAKMDIAVQEFDLLGLQNENQQLRLSHATAAAVANSQLVALKAQYEQALATIHDQEKVIQRQAKDLDECQAWILGHITSTNHSRHNDSAISHELEALEGRGCVSQSVWSSRFQPGVLSGKIASIKQHETAVAQVVALHVRVGQSVQAHALRVADAVKVEQALLEEAGDVPRTPAVAATARSTQPTPPDSKTPAAPPVMSSQPGMAKQDQDPSINELHNTFDQVALDLGALVGRYSPVQAS